MRNTKLLVEGWRGVVHSFCQVNYGQLVSMSKKPNLDLRFHDTAYFSPSWQKAAGIFRHDHEKLVEAIPPLKQGETPDAIYRISSPYDFSLPVNIPKTVYVAFEVKGVPLNMLLNFVNLETTNTCDLFKITVGSQWVKDILTEFGIKEEKIYVVAHGFDPLIFNPAPETERARIRSEFKISGFNFLNVSGMFHNKGIDLLLDAFSVVLEKHKEARLILKGSDTIYASSNMVNHWFSNLSEKKKYLLRPNIIFYGGNLSAENMAKLYNAADCYVSPYRAEGFNMPVLEAMACACPIICTGGGATDDFVFYNSYNRIDSKLVKDKSQGDYLEPDRDHLIFLMNQAIEKNNKSRRSASENAQRAANMFNWDTVTDKLLRVVFEV